MIIGCAAGGLVVVCFEKRWLNRHTTRTAHQALKPVERMRLRVESNAITRLGKAGGYPWGLARRDAGARQRDTALS